MLRFRLLLSVSATGGRAGGHKRYSPLLEDIRKVGSFFSQLSRSVETSVRFATTRARVAAGNIRGAGA